MKTTINQRKVLKELRDIFNESNNYNDYRDKVIEYARTQQLLPSEEVFKLTVWVSPVK